MSQTRRLSVGDAVLVSIDNKLTNNENNDNQQIECIENIRIGVIKYIGYIDGFSMSEYIGIELVESIDKGHNGTINGCQYFNCDEGHGIYTRITNIIRKLSASEIAIKMQEILTLFRTRLDQYVEALSERDEYIERLKCKQKYLRQLLNESKALQKHLHINYHRESSTMNRNTLQTESPSFSSVDTVKKRKSKSISTVPMTLFNLQKQNKKLSSSISIPPKWNICPITPISATSDDTRSEVTGSPSSRSRISIKKRYSNHDTPRKLTKKDTFPDTKKMQLSISKKQKPKLLPTIHSNKCKSPSLAPTDESLSSDDDENKYDDDTISDAETLEICNSNKQRITRQSNKYDDYSSFTEEYHSKHHSKSVSITTKSRNSRSMSFDMILCQQAPQQQYTYSHITQQQFEKKQMQNRLIPMHLNNINHPIQTQRLQLVQTHSNPNTYTPHQQNLWIQQQQNYQMQYNNHPYYVQSQNENWMQSQQQNKYYHN